MWPFAKKPPEVLADLPSARRLNELETRIERLELDSSERHLAVLNSINKVMGQLRARERMHATRHSDSDDSQEGDSGSDLGGNGSSGRPALDSTAHLARRFRGL